MGNEMTEGTTDTVEESQASSEVHLEKLMKEQPSERYAVSGSVQLVADPTNPKERCIQFTVNKGYMQSLGSDGNTTERTEIVELADSRVPIDQSSTLSLEYFIPSDFPQIDNRCVILQVKSKGRPSIQTSDTLPLPDSTKRSPPIAIQLRQHRLQLVVMASDGDKIRSSSFDVSPLLGRWFSLRLEYQIGEKGFARVYVDDNVIMQYEGSILPSHAGDIETYAKAGLYRDTMQEPMTVYMKKFQRSAPSPANQATQESS